MRFAASEVQGPANSSALCQCQFILQTPGESSPIIAPFSFANIHRQVFCQNVPVPATDTKPVPAHCEVHAHCRAFVCDEAYAWPHALCDGVDWSGPA